jgi:hypothetical protein
MNWTAERRLYEAYRDSSLLEVEGSKNVASGFTGVQIDFLSVAPLKVGSLGICTPLQRFCQ